MTHSASTSLTPTSLCLSVCAPSRQWVNQEGFFDATVWQDVWAACRELGVLVRYQGQCFDCEARFAGTDAARKAGLLAACECDEADLMMALRGGYGAMRTLAQLSQAEWTRWQEAPLTMMGYSDFTAINLAYWAKTGRASWQGPTMKDLVDVDTLTWESLQAVKHFVRAESDYICSVPRPEHIERTSYEGVMWGGNLSVLVNLVGTPWWPREGEILFLEDQGESAWQVERMLWQLALSGVFERTKVLWWGDFKGIDRATRHEGDFSSREVFKQLEAWGVTVIEGLPFGHIHRKVALPVGAPVTLTVDDNAVTMTLKRSDWR